MVVDKYKDSVAKDGGERVLLLLPVPRWLVLLHTVSAQVVDRANHHHEEDDDACVGRKDLQPLGVLDVAKAEDSAQEAKEENRDFVDPRCLLFESAHVAISDERDALVQRLGT